ncbi:unnamed protein product [Albugo candida]|uniref:RxLR effector protein n=1 Tax=Albugo candida TaxID=65357 RepID=A0A024G4J9_9STRA|nr:unnamed protein product [Albugo candida]|eukprot:CCI41779.1 unnamed protein product [Albugo candida]
MSTLIARIVCYIYVASFFVQTVNTDAISFDKLALTLQINQVEASGNNLRCCLIYFSQNFASKIHQGYACLFSYNFAG